MECFCHLLPRWLQDQSFYYLLVSVSGMMAEPGLWQLSGMWWGGTNTIWWIWTLAFQSSELDSSWKGYHLLTLWRTAISTGRWKPRYNHKWHVHRVMMKGPAHPQGNRTRGPNLSRPGCRRTGTLNLRLIRRNGHPKSFEVRPPFWPKRSHCLVNCPLDIFL